MGQWWKGGGKGHAANTDHRDVFPKDGQINQTALRQCTSLYKGKTITLAMLATMATPPVHPVRSLEFYFDDGNIVFQVRATSCSPYRHTLTFCWPAGVKYPLQTPQINSHTEAWVVWWDVPSREPQFQTWLWAWWFTPNLSWEWCCWMWGFRGITEAHIWTVSRPSWCCHDLWTK